jgi:AAA domain
MTITTSELPAAFAAPAETRGLRPPIATPYEEIDALDPEWLWPGRIARGEVTILAGQGGIGKGYLGADLVSKVSRGDPMPGTTKRGRPAHVIMITPEDSAQTSFAPRLTAADADLRLVHDLTETSAGTFQVPDDLPTLRAAIDEIGDVAMVWMDPLSAVSSVSLSTASRVRQQIMNPLQRLARDTGIALVVVHHVVKSGAIAGSTTIVDAARSVLKVTRDEMDERIRVIELEKSNIASGDTEAILYTVQGEWPNVTVTYTSSAPGAPAPIDDGTLTPLDAGGRLERIMGDYELRTAQQAARDAKCSYGMARQLLNRMVLSGKLQENEGWYWVPQPEPLVAAGPSCDSAE